jgi:hypothetical protein
MARQGSEPQAGCANGLSCGGGGRVTRRTRLGQKPYAGRHQYRDVAEHHARVSGFHLELYKLHLQGMMQSCHHWMGLDGLITRYTSLSHWRTPTPSCNKGEDHCRLGFAMEGSVIVRLTNLVVNCP